MNDLLAMLVISPRVPYNPHKSMHRALVKQGLAYVHKLGYLRLTPEGMAVAPPTPRNAELLAAVCGKELVRLDPAGRRRILFSTRCDGAKYAVDGIMFDTLEVAIEYCRASDPSRRREAPSRGW